MIEKCVLKMFRLIAAVAAQESQTSLLSTVMQQEMAQRRQRAGISRQDSRLSVKSLIESIEKSSTHVRIIWKFQFVWRHFLTRINEFLGEVKWSDGRFTQFIVKY